MLNLILANNLYSRLRLVLTKRTEIFLLLSLFRISLFSFSLLLCFLLHLIQFQSVLFRKRWRNAASKYKRETTIRTAPTECFHDASDDGTVIKSQETILVCIPQKVLGNASSVVKFPLMPFMPETAAQFSRVYSTL